MLFWYRLNAAWMLLAALLPLWCRPRLLRTPLHAKPSLDKLYKQCLLNISINILISMWSPMWSWPAYRPQPAYLVHTHSLSRKISYSITHWRLSTYFIRYLVLGYTRSHFDLSFLFSGELITRSSHMAVVYDRQSHLTFLSPLSVWATD